jgi:hypothetical protein
MNEAKRFLRYVTPGLVLLVLTYLYCWILKRGSTSSALAAIGDPASQLIAAIAGAGGVGFLLQSIHHGLLWHVYEVMPPSWAMFIDHQSVLRGACPQSLVVAPEPALERRFVTATVCTVVLEMNRTDPNLEKAADRIDRLWDLLHSVGSVMIASFLAPFAAVVWTARTDGAYSGWPECVAFAVLAALMFAVVLANYRFLVRSTQAITCGVLLSYLTSRTTRLFVRCPVDEPWQAARVRKVVRFGLKQTGNAMVDCGRLLKCVGTRIRLISTRRRPAADERLAWAGKRVVRAGRRVVAAGKRIIDLSGSPRLRT